MTKDHPKMTVRFSTQNHRSGHAELVSASIKLYVQTLKQVQGDAIHNTHNLDKQTDHLFRSEHPHVEWKKMAGMRDKLIHNYIGVDKWGRMARG